MSAFAIAIQWLARGYQVLRRNRTVARATLGALLASNENLSRRVERFFEKLDKVETIHGQHTDFWALVERVAKTGTPETLTVENARYGMNFKRAFDKTIKPIGVKLLDKADAPEPAEPEGIVPPMDDDEENDDEGTAHN